jgi:hypothetical protein
VGAGWDDDEPAMITFIASGNSITNENLLMCGIFM